MTQNDYVLSLLAIVSGLAVTHMIASLYNLLAERDKDRWDWLALTAAGIVGYTILYGWWVSWAAFHARTGPLPFWRFLMPVLSVTALVLAARAALPGRVPERGLELAERYAANGAWIWRALLASTLLITAGLVIRRMTGEPFEASAAPWGLAGLIVMAALLVCLSLVRSRRVHAALVPLLALLLVISTVRQTV